MRAPCFCTMKMLALILTLSIVLLFSGCQHTPRVPQAISIDSVSAVYRTEESFKGIIEAFTQRECTKGRVFLRTNVDKRKGLYFVVKFDHSLGFIKPGSVIKLSFVTNDSTQDFEVTLVMPKVEYSVLFQNELFLGITDDDHPFTKATKLVAWSIKITDERGQCVARKNFAW